MRTVKKGSQLICVASLVLLQGAMLPVQAQELEVINILTSNDASCSPYPQIVSDELGFFAEEGIKINLLSSSTTIPYVVFLANGQADLAMLDAGQILQAVNAGQPLSVIYEAYQGASDGLVVPKDSEIKSVADLKGKTIGMASNRDQLSTVIALSTVDMDISDVETVVVGESGPVVAQALRDNTIQVYGASISEFTALTAAGVEIREITPIELSQVPGNSWSAWQPSLEAKRSLFERFLRAWAKGQHIGVMDTKMVMSACKKRIPEQWEQPGIGEKVVHNSVFITQLRKTLKYGELQTDIWESIQGPYIANGEIQANIDVARFLDASFIEPANSFETADVKKAVKAWKESNKEILIP